MAGETCCLLLVLSPIWARYSEVSPTFLFCGDKAGGQMRPYSPANYPRLAVHFVYTANAGKPNFRWIPELKLLSSKSPIRLSAANRIFSPIYGTKQLQNNQGSQCQHLCMIMLPSAPIVAVGIDFLQHCRLLADSLRLQLVELLLNNKLTGFKAHAPARGIACVFCHIPKDL